ncbi:MAG: thioredoxin family protein [Bacteroidales bacterium]|nr:thioredoxin family protein [Bacteroidales bacterium]
MKRLTFITALILLTWGSLLAQIVQPVHWSYSAKKVDTGLYDLIIEAQIDLGWHLYSISTPEGGPLPTVLTLEPSDHFVMVDSLKEDPVPEETFDELFEMKIRFHSLEAKFIQRIKIVKEGAFTLKGTIEGQACDDSQCTLVNSDIAVTIKPEGKATTKTEVNTSPPASPKKDKVNRSRRTDLRASVDLNSRSLRSLFFIAFLAGLLALLTPCVFPMIPMTVSFFMHGEKSKKKSLFEALFFGISIILIYTIIGTLVAVLFGPGVANFLSTHWIPNVLFFIIFILFAAWFFGMYEINLPNWMITRSDKQVDKGGFGGPFFMAFTLVLVSFSCTGPIVGTILVESAGGALEEPIIGMLGFSLAFAIPFTLFAIFPSWLNQLPKSGGWLNSVKVVLGFIELALGLKFLSIADQTYHWHILDREIYLALWIVIFTLMGFYLLGKIRFKHDSEVKHVGVMRLFLVIITFSFVVYMIPGMFGAPLKALSGYLPPMTTLDFDIHRIVRENAGQGSMAQEPETICDKPKYSDQLELPWGLKGYFDYDQGMACARKLDKPVFIDFTGHGCVNCREMEANVWSDSRVLKRLRENYVIIALYVDDKMIKLNKSDWVTSTYDGKVKNTLGKKYQDFQITRFGTNSQPYYVLLDTKGEMLTDPKAYNLDVESFIEFLDRGLNEFRKRKGR